jgi:hypothetical protein
MFSEIRIFVVIADFGKNGQEMAREHYHCLPGTTNYLAVGNFVFHLHSLFNTPFINRISLFIKSKTLLIEFY